MTWEPDNDKHYKRTKLERVNLMAKVLGIDGEIVGKPRIYDDGDGHFDEIPDEDIACIDSAVLLDLMVRAHAGNVQRYPDGRYLICQSGGVFARITRIDSKGTVHTAFDHVAK